MTAEDAQRRHTNDFLHKLQSWQMRHKHQQNCSSLQPHPRKRKTIFLLLLAKTCQEQQRRKEKPQKTSSFFFLHWKIRCKKKAKENCWLNPFSKLENNDYLICRCETETKWNWLLIDKENLPQNVLIIIQYAIFLWFSSENLIGLVESSCRKSQHKLGKKWKIAVFMRIPGTHNCS